jgi:tape measure domain-containing protein
MSNIENQVVSLSFDSSAFEQGVSRTLASLDNLTKSLDFSAARTGFDGIQAQANSVDLSNMAAGIDNISNKFGALGAIAFTTLQDITNSAITAAKDMFSSTVGQVLEGGAARSLAIEQAKFQFAGLGQDVEASMQSALDAVSGTAYGLDEAATLAGIFGAAGIDAGDQLTGALRGVAGVASIAGRGFSEMGQIFQNVAAIGHVTTNDLNSLALRGLGFDTVAKAFGITVEELREQATAGTIDFERFATAMDNAFGSHAKDANQTYTGALKNLRSAMSRMGADFQTPKFAALRPIFIALAEAIDSVRGSLEPLISVYTAFVSRTSRLTVNWLEALDFTTLTRIVNQVAPYISKIFQNLQIALKSFIAPFKLAFRDLIPGRPAEKFAQIARAIEEFTAGLRLSAETINKLKRTFSGVLAVISIVWEVFKGLVSVVTGVFDSLAGVSNGFLSFTANAGDALVSLKEFLVDGGRIQGFFTTLNDAIAEVIETVKNSEFVQSFSSAVSSLGDALQDLFNGFDDGDSALGRFEDRFTSADSAVQRLGDAILTGLGWIMDGATAIFDYLADAFDGLGESIANSLSEGNFDEALDVVNVVLLGGLAALIHRFMDGGISFSFSTLGFVNATLARLNTTLAAMAIEIRAGALLKIAEALALMAVSVALLASIDSAALTRALTALATGLAELIGTMALLTSAMAGPLSAVRIVAMAGSIFILGGAMMFMAIAVKMFSTMEWGELVRGLFGTGAALLMLSLAVKPLMSGAPGMVRAGVGMMAIGIALNIVALAVRQMASLSWGELVKGLGGVGAALTGLVIAMNLMPAAGMVKAGIGLQAMSVGLIAVSLATMLMSTMDWDDMARGLVGLGAALTGLVIASNAMSGGIVGAVAIGIMAGSMILLSTAVQTFTDMSWGELAKGLVGLAASLTIIGLAALIMTPVIPSLILLGLALVPMAFGLSILSGALRTFSSLGWAELFKGLVGMALALALLGAASLVMTPMIPFMILFGAALIVLGAGLVLAGAGAYLFARAVQILAEAGTSALGWIMDFFRETISLLPELMAELATGVIAFLEIIIDAAPGLISGIITILGDLLAGIIELAPQIAEALTAIITTMATLLVDNAPTLVAAGIELLLALLQGLRTSIGEIATVAIDIIVSFINTLAANIGRIVMAGANLIVAFLQGIARGNMRIVAAAINIIVSVLQGIANGMGRIITAGTNIVVNFINGMANSMTRVINAGVNFVITFLNGIRSASNRITNAAMNLVINLVNDLANNIRNHQDEMEAAGGNLADAIIDGMTSAIRNGLSAVTDAIGDMAQNAIDAAKGILGIGSPSRVFADMGTNLIEGLVIGIDDHGDVIQSTEALSDDVVSTMSSLSKRMNDALGDMTDLNPTISPVLDLTDVEKKARDLDSIFAPNPLLADVSYGQAQSISVANAAASEIAVAAVTDSGPKQVIFEQTINAPTELSAIQIYRQTKNQITIAKEELML